MRIHVVKEDAGRTAYLVEPRRGLGMAPVFIRGDDGEAHKEEVSLVIAVVSDREKASKGAGRP